MTRPIPSEGRKRERVVVEYTNDFDKTSLIRTDLLIENGNYRTPVTESLIRRLRRDRAVSSVPARDFEPRRIELCQALNRREKISTVICPYWRQEDIAQQLSEIKNEYEGKRLRLIGEQQPKVKERNQL